MSQAEVGGPIINLRCFFFYFRTKLCPKFTSAVEETDVDCTIMFEGLCGNFSSAELIHIIPLSTSAIIFFFNLSFNNLFVDKNNHSLQAI